MKILNKSGKDIQLIPSDGDPPQGYTVKKGFMMTITKPTKGNLPISFRAVDPSDQKIMKINGKEDIALKPTPQKATPTTMEILLPGQTAGWLLCDDKNRNKKNDSNNSNSNSNSSDNDNDNCSKNSKSKNRSNNNNNRRND